jgi:hypothetical protein
VLAKKELCLPLESQLHAFCSGYFGDGGSCKLFA